MIKAIFWDFDGVIAESVNIKTDAFYELYLPYGKSIAEKVRKHHLENGGISRFEKFKYYQSHFLNQPEPIDDLIIKNLADRFSQIVLDNVIHAPFVTGIENVLESFFADLDFYVVSGTPTEEMKYIIHKRGLNKYFKGVYGSPETKSYWTKELINQNNYNTSGVLFIGDALSDYKAAQDNDIKFLLRRHNDNVDLFKNYSGYSINDFRNFNEEFAKINK